jgi:hypothetical protein
MFADDLERINRECSKAPVVDVLHLVISDPDRLRRLARGADPAASVAPGGPAGDGLVHA